MALEITGTAQWQAWQDRVLPPVERVRDGLWSIPVPIPDNPLRYVLVYALESGDGVVLVDAGWPAEESWQALCDGLTEMGTAVEHVKAVLVTHNHADHLGLAGRVREASGAYVALHALDATPLGPEPGTREEWHDGLRRHLTRNGMPDAEAADTVRAMNTDLLFGAPRPDVLLQDGERIKLPGLDLTVVWTPGHSPGHSCFHQPGRRLLFSGDHVLPRITPAVGVYARTVGDPLADFLLSLERLERYDVEEVLPAHEYRFSRLDQRLVQMAKHHTERLAETYAAVNSVPGATGWELAARLEWSRPWGQFGIQQRRFALGETLAHLKLLAARGEIVESGSEPARWLPAEPASR
ncbi:MBL fold metallo-hydrolase [Streptomyces cavernicola]|uniref:MBL fold metallo-hydrolase n=1 Tax=Streptomyces cavernicola TaxID=3043613 RepID=A0ABT6SFF3_9ACTN|nr:MBL fold metallo-hydrolase [Streptomyces sp. B-S-A6]MDI3406932.1 MBL fold metallo-hydrolase [Streptomyces sp. B-S-A6]